MGGAVAGASVMGGLLRNPFVRIRPQASASTVPVQPVAADPTPNCMKAKEFPLSRRMSKGTVDRVSGC